MFNEEMEIVCGAAQKKTKLYNKGISKYIMISALGGLFVGLGVMLLYTVGGTFDHAGSPFTKIAMGLCFGCALSFAIMAGADLFTSNAFVMSIGALYKKVTWGDFVKILVASWIGNLVGSVVIGAVYAYSNGGASYVQEFFVHMAEVKMTAPALDLFLRGILCNILVCLAAWLSYKLKSEAAKLVMIFWCLFVFITSGFEHSVANMTLFTISLLLPHAGTAVSLGGAFYNLLIVTIGNFIGGVVFLALPYYFISKDKNK